MLARELMHAPLTSLSPKNDIISLQGLLSSSPDLIFTSSEIYANRLTQPFIIKCIGINYR
ncbi:hypothetical protein BpHYR1_040495 [Brachionus plicatilis]|uniref:Uncharacterized protein n=1 Tax=Brachionus plicatilis TaxID=10195 RepID=A0A3M7RJL4_BRAPC|nr:hypothetical protein BpHYR1_040495 [Brachionus plicatilis]